MTTISITSEPEPQEWGQVIGSVSTPEANQTWEWGEVMSAIKGVNPIRLLAQQDGKPVGILQAFEWKIGSLCLSIGSGESGGGGGPVVSEELPPDFRLQVAEKLLGELITESRKRHTLKLTIYTAPNFGESLPPLPPAKHATKWTPVVRLLTDAQRMLDERVKQKARNQINKSIKNSVRVVEGSRSDLEQYQAIQSELVKKKHLASQHLNSVNALKNVWDTLADKNMIKLFLAKYKGQTVGGAMILYSGTGLLYRSGVLTEEGRSLYAGNALQWAIISDAIRRGYRTYNMSGAAADPSDPRYGITKFKLSFGGELRPFLRYSASGNRILRFLVYRLMKIFGRNEWFPLPIYP